MNWDLRVPFGYGTQTVTLRWLNDWLLEHHHPEYVRRLIAWLHFKDGQVGVGGGWRAGGTQPDKPGFAPEGKSFHQDQEFADGFTGAAAVDLVVRNPGAVHRAPKWSEVPAQGSASRLPWGVHCNISTETWHMQWCDGHLPGGFDLDGWQSWWNAGRPGPLPNYPLPPEHDPNAPITQPPETLPPEDDMAQMPVTVVRHKGTADVKLQLAVPNEETLAVWGLSFADVVLMDPLTAREKAELEASQGYAFTPYEE